MTARHPYVAWRDTQAFNAAGTQAQITYPANCQDGDLVFVYFRVAENPGTVTYPAFFTNLVADATFTVGTNDSRVRLAYFIRNAAAQGSTLTISWGTSQFWTLAIVGWRNVDTTTPFAVLPQNNQTTGSVNGGSTFPYNGHATVSEGQVAFLLTSLQSDLTDEGIPAGPNSGDMTITDIDSSTEVLFDAMSGSDAYIETDSYVRAILSGMTSIAGGNVLTLSTFGTAASTYYTWNMLLNPRPIVITDVDGDETWDDGSTGLIVTGTGLGP